MRVNFSIPFLFFKDDIGLGAVVGSADYNVMFVISVCALFSKEVSWGYNLMQYLNPIPPKSIS